MTWALTPATLAFLNCAVPCLALRQSWAIGMARSPQTPVVVAIGGAFAVAGLVLVASDLIKPRALSAFVAPLAQVGLIRAGYAGFRASFGRLPADVFMNWTPGLKWDRVFTIVLFLAMLLPFNLLTGPAAL